LRKEGRANNFSIGTGLVLDVVGIVFVSWKAGITTHFAKRCSSGRSFPGAVAAAVAAVIRPHFYIDVD
jgi:drug/metabolite transporter (DMT)-like permease